MENQTTVNHFVLMGFSYSASVQNFLFVIFVFIYTVTVVGNTVIMTVIRRNSHLQSPMYFFLSHLSFIDICFSSATVPRLLVNFCITRVISYSSCIVQAFILFMMASTEAFILAAMAYDRYTAVCKPLHYGQIMNNIFCRQLAGGAWAISFFYAVANVLPLFKLVFCGPDIIRHFSCEHASLLPISCTDILLNRITFFLTGIILACISFFIILASYINIVSTVLKMRSAEAKRKTFSTCSSHLIVVVLYFSTVCFRYMRPSSASSIIVDEFFSMQYSISTPMLNPIIYSLKTREVKEAIKKLMGYKPLTSHVT